MSDRLVVRVTPSFREDLDRQLSSDRGPNGEPSKADFESVELGPIVEEFATGFFALPTLISGRHDYRLLVRTGMLFRGMSVTGQQVQDGAVELLKLEIDLNMNWE